MSEQITIVTKGGPNSVDWITESVEQVLVWVTHGGREPHWETIHPIYLSPGDIVRPVPDLPQPSEETLAEANRIRREGEL